ncbi:hypothetical protein NDU88_001301 [Pleurodeles waltl]|uniref:Uncharacterized protein n=1 Tax=Pleurodeles waltl TaxID=8319 RepID=A0AAV7THE6_PLEWA|nr:hypothetical protein NDU88_001301 [Pleurodeles waltl]
MTPVQLVVLKKHALQAFVAKRAPEKACLVLRGRRPAHLFYSSVINGSNMLLSYSGAGAQLTGAVGLNGEPVKRNAASGCRLFNSKDT